MKKRIIGIICAAVIMAGLPFLIKEIFFGSYDTSFEITDEQIENRILINKITNAINEDCFSQSLSQEDAGKYIAGLRRPDEYDGVVDELARAALMRSILTEENCAVGYDEAKRAAESEYRRMKTGETSAAYYQSVKKVLSEFNISEKEYLELLYDSAYDLYNEAGFNAWFKRNKYKKADRDPELVYADEYAGSEEQIKAYLDEQMKKVTVEIK